MYYNARWYDPALGRFAQADSIVPPGVQGLDRYAYVNNNPMRYTDPTGHCPICVIMIGTGLALVGAVMAIDQINYGAEEYNWASQQSGLAGEQQAAQQWQDNCMGQCHYAHAAETTPGAIVGGERPATPIGDVLVDGAWNMTQGATSLVGSAAEIGIAGAAANKLMSFNNKGSMFLTADEFNTFGDSYGGNRGYTFITSPVGGDIAENAASIEEMGRLLGRDFPSGSTIYRIDIDNIAAHNSRMPFAGNKYWIPGGFTRGGLPERIIDSLDLRYLNRHTVIPK